MKSATTMTTMTTTTTTVITTRSQTKSAKPRITTTAQDCSSDLTTCERTGSGLSSEPVGTVTLCCQSEIAWTVSLRGFAPSHLMNKGKGGHKRRSFTWILSGDEFIAKNQPIVIALHNNLKFQIVVAQHDIHSALSQENVAQFRHRVDTSVNGLSFSGLGFQSLDSTAAPSGAQTPSTDTILLNNSELGRGAQAVVTRVWDVSTGLEYASSPRRKRKWQNRS